MRKRDVSGQHIDFLLTHRDKAPPICAFSKKSYGSTVYLTRICLSSISSKGWQDVKFCCMNNDKSEQRFRLLGNTPWRKHREVDADRRAEAHRPVVASV